MTAYDRIYPELLSHNVAELIKKSYLRHAAQQLETYSSVIRQFLVG